MTELEVLEQIRDWLEYLAGVLVALAFIVGLKGNRL